MKITINGQAKEFNNINSLNDLVNLVCKNPQHVITEINGAIITTDNWKTTTLKDGDTLELVTFVGGG